MNAERTPLTGFGKFGGFWVLRVQGWEFGGFRDSGRGLGFGVWSFRMGFRSWGLEVRAWGSRDVVFRD